MDEDDKEGFWEIEFGVDDELVGEVERLARVRERVTGAAIESGEVSTKPGSHSGGCGRTMENELWRWRVLAGRKRAVGRSTTAGGADGEDKGTTGGRRSKG